MKHSLFIALLLSLLWVSPAFADPVTLIIAAATAAGTTGLAYVAGHFAAGVAFSTVFGYFAASFGITLGLGYLAQALQPGLSATVNRGYTVAGITPAADQAVIYGQTRVGGVIVHKEVTDKNRWLHQVIAIAGHECEEIVAIYFDDKRYLIASGQSAEDRAGRSQTDPENSARFRAKDGRGKVSLSGLADNKDGFGRTHFEKIKVEVYYGDPDQKASKALVAASEDGQWTSAHRLQGICYVYLALRFDSDAWPNGEPNLSFEVKGKRIFDPRLSIPREVWSDNAALIMRDYIMADYGVNDTATDDRSFAAAANVCDEIVVRDPSKPITDSNNSEKRYTANGSFRVGSVVKEVMNDINLSMDGLVWYTQGKWKVKPGHYTPPIATFGEDDMRSSLKIVTRKSRRDNFNTVTGLFKGPGTNYTPTDYPAVENDTFLREDNGIVSSISLDYPMTDSVWTAQRISNIALRRNREQVSVMGLFGLNAFQVQVGDHILLNNERVGWVNKEFQILDWKLKPDKKGNLSIEMEMHEISPNVFVDYLSRKGTLYDSDAEIVNNNTGLFNFHYLPAIGISAVASTRVNNENLINVITVTTSTNEDEWIQYVEVRYRNLATDRPPGRLVGSGEVGIAEITDLAPGNYEVSVQGVNTVGVRGPISYSGRVQVEKDATPPANITGFSYNLIDSNLFFEWDASPDLDLSFYRIRYAGTLANALYSDAITVASKIPRPATSVSLPAMAGTYMIKAIDKSGNQSVQAAQIVIRPEDLQVFSHEETATESPVFSGSNTWTVVQNGVLSNRAALATSLGLEGEYLFANAIDLGASHRARVSVEMDLTRYQSGTNFDDLLGDFDGLGGTFDKVSDGTEHDDINVVSFVSFNDGPKSSGGGWSEWRRFTVADIYARSFRFRIALISERLGVSIDITSLVARVRYNG